MNKTKTKMVIKNMEKNEIEILEQESGIKVVKKVKYFGVWMTAKNINLFNDNYQPV